MRTPATNTALEITITRTRLTRYLIETNNDLDMALSRYELNMRLSEAFYTPLQCCEIALRNVINAHMESAYGPDWFHSMAVPLNQLARNMIADAERELQHLNPIPRGAIVAELKFAFWVSLLGKQYDTTLWRQTIYRGFLKGGGKTRSIVHGRFNMIRRFRNRVAHHEPIYERDLNLTHDEILEAIGWMCPDTRAWTAHHSRAPTVIAAQ